MILETNEHRQHEGTFADDLAYRFDFDFKKTAQFCRIDFVLLCGKRVMGFAELKERIFSFYKFKSVMVDFSKLAYLMSIADYIPVYLFIRYTDQDIMLTVNSDIQFDCVYQQDNDLCTKSLIDRKQFQLL